MAKLHGWRTGSILVCVLALFLAGTLSAAAEISPGYKKGEVVLVGEKDKVAPRVIAVRNGTIATLDALDWEEGGIHGQAVHLNGAGDYIEYSNRTLCSGEITVAGWVKWMGSAVDNPQAELNQQLFTVFRDADNYFTLNLHAYRDNVRQTEDGTVFRMDGVALEYKIAGSAGKHVEAFNLTSGGVDYAIRKNEWTHLAMTISKRAIKLYINGVHWFEEPLQNANKTLSANGVRIGGTVGKSPYTLLGLVDDVAVFKGILDTETIAYLAAGAGLDFSAPEKKTEPTAVEDDTSRAEQSGDTFKDTDNSSAFSDITIPPFMWVVLGALFVLLAVLTVALNKHEQKRREEDL